MEPLQDGAFPGAAGCWRYYQRWRWRLGVRILLLHGISLLIRFAVMQTCVLQLLCSRRLQICIYSAWGGAHRSRATSDKPRSKDQPKGRSLQNRPCYLRDPPKPSVLLPVSPAVSKLTWSRCRTGRSQVRWGAGAPSCVCAGCWVFRFCSCIDKLPFSHSCRQAIIEQDITRSRWKPVCLGRRSCAPPMPGQPMIPD